MKYTVKASASLLLDQRRKKKNEKYPVKLVIYYDGEKERYSTGIDLTLEQWNKLSKTNLRDDDLKTLRNKLTLKKQKAEAIIEKMEVFSFSQFEELFFHERKVSRSSDLKTLFEQYIADLESKGRVGSASVYNTALHSLLDFRPKLKVSDITKSFLEEYERYMRTKAHASSVCKKYAARLPKAPSILKKGISPTTIGIYMRHLRAIINKAIEDKLLAADKYPFKGYSIPSSRNVKKALNAAQIKQLLNYKTDESDLQRAVDFWLFSYISNGINFTDICYLRPENIHGEFFTFYRAKTRYTKKRDARPIKVPLTKETKAIIQRRKNTDTSNPFLFPILQAGLTAKQEKYRIQDFICKVNKAMSSIAAELGFEGKLGTYVARHSHSTILKRSGASTEMIKENLGHSSVLTTENYLDDFEDEVKLEYARKLTEL